MASLTPNINLTLPTGTENWKRAMINGNFTILDTKIGAVGNTSLQAQVTALNSQITNKTYSMKSGTAAYGVLVRSGNVVFFTVFNQSWNGVASTSITSNDANAVTLTIPTGYKPAYNVEIKESLNDKRITVNTTGEVASNEAFSGLNLRFSGCWITNDPMPS